MIGLKRGVVELVDHNPEWETIAAETIRRLRRIVWCAAASPYFATGQLRGYFGGEPPMEFFELLAFYIASNTLSSIYWAIPFGQGQIDTMMKQSQDVLKWFDSMRNPVPTWYLKNFYLQWIDGVPLKLNALRWPKRLLATSAESGSSR